LTEMQSKRTDTFLLSRYHGDLSYLYNLRTGIWGYLFPAVLLSQFIIIPYFFHIDGVAKALLSSFVFLVFILQFKGVFSFNQRFSYFSIALLLLLSASSSSFSGWIQLFFLFLLVVYTLILLTYNKRIPLFELFLKSYTFFIVIVSVLGLYEYFSSFFLGPSNKMLIPYLLPLNSGMRVVGIYGQPNLFALLLLSGLLVFLYQHLHGESFSTQRLSKLKYLPFLTVALVFFLTGSRAGLLAFSLTYLPLCWLKVRKRYLADDFSGRKQFIHLSCVLLLAFGVSYALNSFVDTETLHGLGDTGISTDARFLFWTSAVLIFLDHPWFGVGLGNFKYYLPKYINQAHDTLGFIQYEAMGYTKWAHNELLQLLCEGGIFVFLIVIFLLSCFFFQLILYASGRRQWSPLKLYSHLFILPFIIQSMFSWPMRHSALLILFFTFLGFLLSQYRYKTMTIPPWGRLLVRCGSLCGLVLILLIGFQEVRMGSLVHTMDRDDIQASFPKFERLVASSYAEYPLLVKVTPRYIYSVMKKNDIDFAEKIFPYVKRLVDLQGAHWQWYNLSLVCHLLHREKDANFAVEQAIHLYPAEDIYWSFLHYLNMLKASNDTGRPVEDFYPHPPGGQFKMPEGFRVGS